MTDALPAPAEAVATLALQVTELGKQVPLPSGTLTILDGVSFTIAAGDTVAVVGASGSGKSTLLSLLAGLDTPSRGQVRLHGELLSAMDEDGRARVRGKRSASCFRISSCCPH